MKRLMFGIAVLALVSIAVRADTYTYSVASTNGIATTNDVLASGWLDKIEVAQDASATCTVVVATYDMNGTAVETYASLSSMTAASTIVRPGAVRTSNAGVALTSAITGGNASNVTQVITVPYDRIMIGGNTKIITTGSGGPAAAKNNVKTTVFFEPLKK